MCGIFGFESDTSLTLAELKAVTDSMEHRGPDSSGYVFEHNGKWNTDAGTCGLGHRRLAVIDLSDAAAQPMVDPETGTGLVYNGEIYNFRELRTELEKDGVRFCSQSDTEVLLKGVLCHGMDFISRVNGMFAFGIRDAARRQWIVCRDRLGIKPVYYTQMAGGFAFASELKPLMQLPWFDGELDRQAVELYLQFHYIPAPRTIFRSVRKLKPGHFITVTDRQIREHRYWNALDAALDSRTKQSEEACADELAELLDSSVRMRLISDVPVGAFLSGGYDSSMICSAASRASSSGVESFSIGFDDRKFNEAEHAKRVADAIGTTHNCLYAQDSLMDDVLEQLPVFYDEPFADSSAIPTTIISERMRSRVTVALGGDGGDELFCGYNRHEWLRKLHRFSGFFSGVAGMLSGVLPWEKARKAAALLGWSSLADQYRCLHNIWKPGELERLYLGYTDVENPAASYFGLGLDVEEETMVCDLHTYLVDDILTKVDRASMSVSLETRVPLLDHRIVEFALRLPLDMKFRNGDRKYLLRKVLYRSVPPALLDRPKQGFAIPLERLLRDRFKPRMMELLDKASLKEHGLFSHAYVDAMLRRFLEKGQGLHYQVWTLMCFQMWWNRYKAFVRI